MVYNMFAYTLSMVLKESRFPMAVIHVRQLLSVWLQGDDEMDVESGDSDSDEESEEEEEEEEVQMMTNIPQKVHTQG